MQIDSIQNSRIKNLIKLQKKSKERKLQSLFCVEGIQENRLALAQGIPLNSVYLADFYSADLDFPTSCQPFEVSSAVYEKIAYRKSTGGIVATYHLPTNNLSDFKPKNSIPLILILEGIEKPGNLGAVLRTADALAADAVILTDAFIDLYNPNVIRSSVGCLFTVPCFNSDKDTILSWLKEQKIQLLATYLHENTQDFYHIDLQQPTAFVFGSEAKGLSEKWISSADTLVKIPMNGTIDSLNLSNTVAISGFEFFRQNNKL